MDDYLAKVLPHQKRDKISKQQQQGGFVAMTCAGANDEHALHQADVSITVGFGSKLRPKRLILFW